METNLITVRRNEVEQEIARLKAIISRLSTELVELDTAERVMARLTGAKRPEVSAANEHAPPRVLGILAKKPTLPEMIETVLREEERLSSHFDGWEPKEIAKEIEDTFKGVHVRGDAVSSITWRMWKRGQLKKVDGTSAYRLPDNEKPADLLSPAGEQSAGLSDQPSAQGGEARPGGGA